MIKKGKKPVRKEKTDPAAPWPDRSAAAWPGMTVRDELDYLAWMAEAAESIGFHGPDTLTRWREAVQVAYDALVDPMVHEHGDPLPPDVPPAQRPGTWPDVPAARIQGMTVRHQLTVIRTIAILSRTHIGAHHQPQEGDRWAARVQKAFDSLHHGPDRPMPDTARTKPPAPPRKVPAAAPEGASKAAGDRTVAERPRLGKPAKAPATAPAKAAAKSPATSPAKAPGKAPSKKDAPASRAEKKPTRKAPASRAAPAKSKKRR